MDKTIELRYGSLSETPWDAQLGALDASFVGPPFSHVLLLVCCSVGHLFALGQSCLRCSLHAVSCFRLVAFMFSRGY